MGAPVNKLLLLLEGRSIFFHTLNHIAQLGCSGRLVVLCRDEERAQLQDEVKGIQWGALKPVWLAGGQERSDSVANGLKYLQSAPGAPVVFVHDGARPFVTAQLVSTLIAGLEQADVAVPAMAVAETTRRSQGEQTEVVNRDNLFLIQTPQAFRFESIEAVFFGAQTSTQSFTDEASYFEAAGRSVKLVEGEARNIKLTRPQDLKLAELYLPHFDPREP